VKDLDSEGAGGHRLLPSDVRRIARVRKVRRRRCDRRRTIGYMLARGRYGALPALKERVRRQCCEDLSVGGWCMDSP